MENEIFLVKISDLMNAKLTQVIQSRRQISAAFSGWQTRFNKYANDEHCHFNLNQEFLARFSLEVNKAMTAPFTVKRNR